MNKLIDVVCVIAFLVGVYFVFQPLVEEERQGRLDCDAKGGAYISTPHVQPYCAPKL